MRDFMLQFNSIARSLLGGLLGLFGKFYTKNKLTVFCFHDVSCNISEFNLKYDLNIPPDIFEYQIEFICKYFNVISPDDLLTGKISKHAALITFDDGFKSYFTTAIPILGKYNLSSIIFLNMSPIKGEIFGSGLIPYLCDKSSGFSHYVTTNYECDLKEKPLYLYCSREIINSYLEIKGKPFKSELDGYVGDFATQYDLELVSSNKLVFFGNHLYNHDVPLLLSDKQLLESYKKNEAELKKYPNYRDMLAFPFGQPGTCFSENQIELLSGNGIKKVFSSYPVVNSDVGAQYLHRISLDSSNNTKAKILFNILWHTFKKKNRKLLIK